MVHLMARPILKRLPTRRRPAFAPSLERLEAREVLSLATGLPTVVDLASIHALPGNLPLPAVMSMTDSHSATVSGTPAIHATRTGRSVTFSGIVSPGSDVVLLPAGDQLQTHSSSTVPVDVPSYTSGTDSNGSAVYTWTTSIVLAETRADATGAWSMTLDASRLPATATDLTFQFTFDNATVSGSFAYDPIALGLVAAPVSVAGAVETLGDIHEVKVGHSVIFSGTTAPGTQVFLVPPGGLTVNTTATLPPVGVSSYTSTSTNGVLTYTWMTSDSVLGETQADGSGTWSISVDVEKLPTVTTDLTFTFFQGLSTTSQSFHYDPSPDGWITLPARDIAQPFVSFIVPFDPRTKR